MEEKSEKRSARRFFCAAERTVLSLLSFGALLFLLFFVIGSAANMWYEEEQLPGRKDLCGLLLLYGVTDMISAVAVCLLSPANRKKRGKGVRPVSGGQPVVRLFVLGALLRIGEIFSLYAYVFVFRFETVNFSFPPSFCRRRSIFRRGRRVSLSTRRKKKKDDKKFTIIFNRFLLIVDETGFFCYNIEKEAFK